MEGQTENMEGIMDGCTNTKRAIMSHWPQAGSAKIYHGLFIVNRCNYEWPIIYVVFTEETYLTGKGGKPDYHI